MADVTEKTGEGGELLNRRPCESLVTERSGSLTALVGVGSGLHNNCNNACYS